MHTFALKLGLVLAAEKSKTPFYIAGGLLVAWALFISLGVGMRKPDFPSSLGQQRAVIAVSAVLVLFAVSMAVATSGGSESKAAGEGASQTTSTATPAAPAAPAETPATGPTATTGTPPPPSSPAAATTTLALAANPQGQLSYDTKKLSAKAGKVTINLSNSAPLEHNVAIAKGDKILGETPTFSGGKRSLTVNLTPGTYTYYCTVPGHRQAGMEGVLTVQ